MALYLPQHHLAIDIIDDPCSAPVDREAFPGVDVVRLTCADLTRPEVIAQLAPMRGRAGADSLRRNRSAKA